MHSLPIFVRLEGRPVILIGEGDAGDAKRRLLERAGARLVGEDAAAAIALIALPGAAADDAARRLKARGVLVNVADRPDLCDFTLPAIVDRSPVVIAVGTGGASAGLAKVVRQRIEALLPARLGALAEGLKAARAAMRERWPNATDRRRALDAALAAGGPLDPIDPKAADGISAWLAAAGDAQASRLVAIVLTSTDPDDMTLGDARLMGEADTLYAHADVPVALLDRARADARRIIVDRAPEMPGPGLSLYIRMA